MEIIVESNKWLFQNLNFEKWNKIDSKNLIYIKEINKIKSLIILSISKDVEQRIFWYIGGEV